MALSGAAISAQDWYLDATFDQSFSSRDPLRTPGGFSVSTGGIAVLGPIGFHGLYRTLKEGGDDISMDCAGVLAPCVPGTLGVSYEMRSAGVGISYDFINPTDVMLTLALTGTRNWRRERLTHRVTGQPFDHELSASLGLSASAHLRLRPLVSGMRPEFAVRYDHSGRGACASGSACWQGHRAFGLSIGVGWVLRVGRAD
jgi:hypothetical protein